MKLFLLRHAHALPGEMDEARRLSPKGCRQVRALSRVVIREAMSEASAIEHSSLVRSIETAQLLRKHFKIRQPLRKLEGLAPNDDSGLTAMALGRSTGSRFLVGHNPHLSQLVARLIGLGLGAEGIRFRKAGMVALERLSRPSPKCPNGKWRLLWMVVPPNDTANS